MTKEGLREHLKVSIWCKTLIEVKEDIKKGLYKNKETIL